MTNCPVLKLMLVGHAKAKESSKKKKTHKQEVSFLPGQSEAPIGYQEIFLHPPAASDLTLFVCCCYPCRDNNSSDNLISSFFCGLNSEQWPLVGETTTHEVTQQSRSTFNSGDFIFSTTDSGKTGTWQCVRVSISLCVSERVFFVLTSPHHVLFTPYFNVHRAEFFISLFLLEPLNEASSSEREREREREWEREGQVGF